MKFFCIYINVLGCIDITATKNKENMLMWCQWRGGGGGYLHYSNFFQWQQIFFFSFFLTRKTTVLLKIVDFVFNLVVNFIFLLVAFFPQRKKKTMINYESAIFFWVLTKEKKISNMFLSIFLSKVSL